MDTLFTKQFGDSTYNNTGRQVVQTPDSGFVLLCESDKFGSSDIQLIKTDKDGNFLWEQYIGGNAAELPLSIDLTPDKGFIIGCNKINATYDPYVVKTDSLGNVEWAKTFGNPVRDDISANIITVSSGGYLISTCYGITEISQSTTEGRLNLIRLDENGDVIWDKKYGPKYRFFDPEMVKELPDGSFVMANVTDGPNNEFAEGLLWKVNANGDSLWSRRFELLTGTWSRNYFRDFTLTKDGSFAVCGFVQPVAPDGGNQDMWLLKLDSMGCLVPGCDTLLSQKSKVESRKGGMKVYPNPSDGKFTVKIVSSEAASLEGISVYNSYGQQVYFNPLNPPLQGEMSIDLGDIPEGVYFMKVGSETVKVVVK